MTTIEALAELLGIDAAATSKAMPVVEARRDASCSRSSAATTGSSEAKLAAALGARRPPGDRGGDPRRRSAPTRARSARSASPARSSPTRRCARASSSPARTAPAGTCAASSTGATSRPRFADIRQAREGDTLPELRRRAPLPDRDRGRAHLQARDALLGAARRDVPRRGRQGEAARHGELRHRARPHDGRGGRAAPRRARDRAGRRRSRRTTCTSSRCRALEEQAEARRAASLEAAGLDVLLDDRDLRAGREVRRRRPDRLPGPRHRRQEDARGRRRRRRVDRRRATRRTRRDRTRSPSGSGSWRWPQAAVQRRSRSGRRVEGLMDENGTTYRALADQTGLSAGYLNHLVHGNRPVPSNEVIATLAEGARRRARALPRVPHPRRSRSGSRRCRTWSTGSTSRYRRA